MVVDRFLDKRARRHRGVDRRPRRVGKREQRLAVDLAQLLTVGFDDRVRPDHLQVENEPAGPDCRNHVAQDVHDVLRFHSSERP